MFLSHFLNDDWSSEDMKKLMKAYKKEQMTSRDYLLQVIKKQNDTMLLNIIRDKLTDMNKSFVIDYWKGPHINRNEPADDFIENPSTDKKEIVTIGDTLYEKYLEDGRVVYKEYIQKEPEKVKTFPESMSVRFSDGTVIDVTITEEDSGFNANFHTGSGIYELATHSKNETDFAKQLGLELYKTYIKATNKQR